jgi:hypothetical protein
LLLLLPTLTRLRHRSVIVTLVAGLLGAKGWLFWAIFIYVFLANFFFQVRTRFPPLLLRPSC